MQPKWMLYSFTIVGLLIVVLTNIMESYSDVFPPQILVAINVALPSLIMLKRWLGDQQHGQPPVTFLPPTKEDKVDALQAQQKTATAELAAVKKAG